MQSNLQTPTMRRPSAVPLFLIALFLLSSCQKELSFETGPGPGGQNEGAVFEVKINGQLTHFLLTGASLVRQVPENLKRLDIDGISTDGSRRLVLTIGDSPAAGNAVAQKEYAIILRSQDDPTTPEDESLGNDNGFLTYLQKAGDNWVAGLSTQKGSIRVTATDETALRVSGTFHVRDSSWTDSRITHFTEGRFTNLPYRVLN